MKRIRKQKDTPIFQRILLPVLVLVCAQISVVLGIFYATGLPRRVSQYSKDITDSKLEARRYFLESIMINRWMNLRMTQEEINKVVQAKVDGGEFTVESLDQIGGKTDELLSLLAGPLIGMMRANQVTGVFLILNTQPLDGGLKDKPGIYLRDIDPLSSFSEKNTDLLIERSPASVIRKTGITTDANWTSCFRFASNQVPYYHFFANTYTTAVQHPELSWKELGYWGNPYQLHEENRYAITYSIPLRLDDGTVYGVLGIDVTLRYLEALLPYAELTDTDEDGCYFFALPNRENTNAFSHVFGSGPANWNHLLNASAFMREPPNSFLEEEGEAVLDIDTDTYYLHALPLRIYNSNVPYADSHWMLGAIVTNSYINNYSGQIQLLFLLASIAVMAFGIIGGILVAFRIRKPVSQLESQLRTASGRNLVDLKRTGIKEIDELSEEIERLNKDMLDAGKKFSRIIKMAEEDLAGFQIDEDKRTLFISDGFFEIFGLEPPSDIDHFSIGDFTKVLQTISALPVEGEDSNGKIYEINGNGKKRYVQLRLAVENGMRFGLAEDVTQRLLRNRILMFERDHDALTGLYNRKAFLSRLTELLDNTRDMGCAALLMMDLDNLKLINDNYGHERGDAYIRMAATTLTKNLSSKALVSRISGDEFNVFLYGKDKAEVMEQIDKLQEAFRDATILVGDDQVRHVHISAGISWWPQDATNYDTLQHYADAALYEAKRSHKGSFETFDLSHFLGEKTVTRRREALVTLLEKRCFHYEYQPIVGTHSGVVFGYEALLRPDMEEFTSPLDVISALRQEGKLHEFENLSVPIAVDTFFSTQMHENSHLFFNSVTNQTLDRNSIDEICMACHGQVRRLVMEISEQDPLELDGWKRKTSWLTNNGGKLALDDYGTGYNTEKNLLRVSPDFIKVDIAIVKNIDRDPDRRQIMEYISNYAHARGKFIIAEGVETLEEAKVCIAYGADYIQGFFFSRSQRVPGGIDPKKAEAVRTFSASIGKNA